jgi:hypothetical protein
MRGTIACLNHTQERVANLLCWACSQQLSHTSPEISLCWDANVDPHSAVVNRILQNDLGSQQDNSSVEEFFLGESI